MRPTSFTVFSRKKERNDNLINEFIEKLIKAGFTLKKKDPELVIVFGGDGSLLKAFHQFAYRGQYILLNTGHLGFFADYKKDEMDILADDIINREKTVENHNLLRFETDSTLDRAATDISLLSDRTCEMHISINGKPFTKTRCTGMVIGNKIGSTGFLSSLGSPVVISDEDIFLYSLIAPVFNNLFPNSISKAILKRGDVLEIKIVDGRVDVSLDGIYEMYVKNKTIKITLSDEKVTMFHLRDIDNLDRINKSIQVKESV